VLFNAGMSIAGLYTLVATGRREGGCGVRGGARRAGQSGCLSQTSSRACRITRNAGSTSCCPARGRARRQTL